MSKDLLRFLQTFTHAFRLLQKDFYPSILVSRNIRITVVC